MGKKEPRAYPEDQEHLDLKETEVVRVPKGQKGRKVQ
jgi:hypothetical protein